MSGFIFPEGYDEQLSAEETRKLVADLAEIGPWAYIRGIRGMHRAERLGTEKHEQASATPEGLLAAVRDCERRLNASSDILEKRTIVDPETDPVTACREDLIYDGQQMIRVAFEQKPAGKVSGGRR